MKPVVFIQTNDRQMLGALLSSYSMKRNSKNPDAFDVRIMNQKDWPTFAEHEGRTFLRGIEKRKWKNEDLQSFTPLRFAPPQLMNYQDKAFVIDPDIFAVGDVMELLGRDMKGKALMCRWRDGGKNFGGYLASSAMLLDCAKLTHWKMEEQFDELFQFKRDYLKWVHLEYEPRETVELFEPEWNSLDELTENTKMLHNTRRNTQPWKAGLPIDYTVSVKPKKLTLKKRIKRFIKGKFFAPPPEKLYYQPHPDPRQEALFFGLLRDALADKVVSEDYLREEMRANHVRHDALKKVEEIDRDVSRAAA